MFYNLSHILNFREGQEREKGRDRTGEERIWGRNIRG